MYKFVSSSENIVLLLTHYWTPLNVTSVKEGLKKLMGASDRYHKSRPKVLAVASDGVTCDWETWMEYKHGFYPEQPFIRSVNNAIPVPTILLTTSNFTYNAKRKPSLRYLYKKYKGICQICGKQMSQKKMTIEHIKPKSKGGGNDYYNITLTCVKCNSRKGSIFPYYDYKGQILKAEPPQPFYEVGHVVRPEWKPFLFRSE
jgi:5-methylcytosine-specific restriction endonuclease McrA